MASIENIASILQQSLLPQTAKQSEVELKSIESQEGFPLTLLHLVASQNLDISIRLAGALFFKNLIKRKWIDESGQYHLSLNDAKLIKAEIVGLMISLPDNLQVQIGEAISLIAESEFPELWPELLDELVSKLSNDDMVTNKGVLKVAHSIFKRWRPLFRSDELFTEIILVLKKFSQPFLTILLRVDQLIDENSNNKASLLILFDNLLLLIKIYYDLNCQDIPEFFEDHLTEGFTLMHKYLSYSNKLIEDKDEEEEIDVLTLVKTNICELTQLYTTRYEEEFAKFIPEFIKSVWRLLVETGPQQKYDLLVSKSINYLASVSSLTAYSSYLNNDEALQEITTKIILPNISLRESDEELFEDDPIEYIRRDLGGSDSDTRRRSAVDLLRGLKESNEPKVTGVVMKYVQHYLDQFTSDSTSWKSKDIALYLFSAIATNGSMTNSGVTSTNLLVDVVQFFANYVAPDLVSDVSHPILKVSAIKYIFTFRNQLTKAQLVETFPLLSHHFQNDNYVVYTYAAVTIEKILSLRNPTNHQELLFSKTDIPTNISKDLLMNLFRLMFSKGDSPEKLAENEFLMKCVMRVLLTAEDSINEFSLEILQQLFKIVEIIAKNPSNPKFSHFTFESIAVIIKNNNQNIVSIMELSQNYLLSLLGNDVQEFIPYSFQILSFILENYPSNQPIPECYIQLIKPLVSPTVWEYKGNIPAVTRLLTSIIKFSPQSFVQPENLTPVLGVFQKLISSKANDHLGFEILEVIFLTIPLNILNSFNKDIAMILLQRLQKLPTEKFIKKFTIFLCTISSLPSNNPKLNPNNLNSTFVIQFLNNVQPDLFAQILNTFLIPNIGKFNNLLDKKILIVGLTNLITENNEFNVSNLNSPYVKFTIPILQSIIKMITSDSIIGYKNINENSEMLLELENEDLTFGSSFNKINVISTRPFDPCSELTNNSRITDYFKSKFQSIINILPSLDQESQQALKSIGL